MTTAGRGEQIQIAACGPADRAEQARLAAQCFKKPLAPGGFEWRYDALPHGPSVSFLARANGAAVSGYACNPRLAIARGDEETLALVGETGDVMTHPDWRKRGIFSRLDRAALEAARRRGWALTFGLPNRKSAHIFVELGWREIGAVRPWAFVLKSDAAAREHRRRDGLRAALSAGMARRTGARARARMERTGAGLSVEPLARFPGDVIELSRRVERDFAFMVRRDARYLDWRFIAAPSRLHRALGVFDPRRELASYAVVQVPRPGEPLGYLVDVLARDAAALDAAVAAALAELERSGASVVEATAIDGSWWSARLSERGFARSGDERRLSVILHPLQLEHPLVSAAGDASRWYFTDGDRDDETMG
jgi:GNAT superfamily N-acetyltransferase